MPPPPVTLIFDLLTLKVVSEPRVTWATFVPILVFLGLSVLDLGPVYATDVRQTDARQQRRLMPPPRGPGHNNGAKETASSLYDYDIPLARVARPLRSSRSALNGSRRGRTRR